MADHIGYICLFQVIMKKLRASVRNPKKQPANHKRRGKCALSSSQAKPSASDGKWLEPGQGFQGPASLAVKEGTLDLLCTEE